MIITVANVLILFIFLLNCYLKGYLDPKKIGDDYLIARQLKAREPDQK